MRRAMCLAVVLAALIAPLSASEVAVAPDVDASRLPSLGVPWAASNPYRAQSVSAEAVAVGHAAYGQACARCHGAEASTNAAPAPDLRNLNRGCRRIDDPELKAWCLRDNDAYFAKTVRHGKIILGVTHMPPWDGVLAQEVAWAIQLFVESRGGAKP